MSEIADLWRNVLGFPMDFFFFFSGCRYIILSIGVLNVKDKIVGMSSALPLWLTRNVAIIKIIIIL